MTPDTLEEQARELLSAYWVDANAWAEDHSDWDWRRPSPYYLWTAEQMRSMNFVEFSEAFLYIENKRGKVVPLRLNRTQLYLTWLAYSQMANGLGVRIIIDKARQQGCSTWCQAWAFWWAVCHDGQRCLTIADKDDRSKELQEKQLNFYKFWPEHFRYLLPAQDQKARGKRFRMMNRSLLFTESAQDADAGRSMTFQHGHLTEPPIWPDFEQSLTAMDPCIPANEPGTTINVESTARGRGNHFYTMYDDASRGLNEYAAAFSPWYWSSDYTDDPRPGELPLGQDPRIKELLELYNYDGITDELELLEKYAADGLTERHLYWYRAKLRTHKAKIGQEYPWTAEESFAASEDTYFSSDILNYIEASDIRPPLYCGAFDAEGNFVRDVKGPWWIFEEPQAFSYYTLGVDSAEGVQRDSHAAQIFNASAGVQAASFQDFGMSKEEYARQCDCAGRWYRGPDLAALCIPEKNNACGAIVLDRLHNTFHYPYIYIHERQDAVNLVMANSYGWTTTPKSRGVMLGELSSKVEHHTWTIRCSRTMGEMLNFINFRKGDRIVPRAAAKSTDDLVMAAALAAVARPWVPTTDPRGQEPHHRETNKVSDIVGW